MSYRFSSLDNAEQFEAYAKEKGVSKVARGEQPSKQSDGGFLQAAKRANGSKKKLSKMPIKKGSEQTWWQRRNNFCARHAAGSGGKGLDKNGLPNRRELGMIMWMCTTLTPQEMQRAKREIAKRGK